MTTYDCESGHILARGDELGQVPISDPAQFPILMLRSWPVRSSWYTLSRPMCRISATCSTVYACTLIPGPARGSASSPGAPLAWRSPDGRSACCRTNGWPLRRQSACPSGHVLRLTPEQVDELGDGLGGDPAGTADFH